MRVIFFGTPEFAVPTLSALLDAGIDVTAVVTQPDRPRGRSHSTLLPSPVKVRATAAGIPVWQPDRPRGDAFLQQVAAAGADLGVVVAYGHLLPAALLAIPPSGFVNVHASLLPRWRGAAPIHWSLLAGDRTTGVTIMRVEAGLDTGAIWEARSLAIDDTDTTATLSAKLATLGATTLVEVLPRIAAGEIPEAQTDAGSSYAPKIDRDVARIRWHEPSRAVACRIRAMDPAPGAWTTLGGSEFKVFGSTIVLTDQYNTPAGTLHPAGGELCVATGNGLIGISEVQPAGKRRLDATQWLRGAALPAGARFE